MQAVAEGDRDAARTVARRLATRVETLCSRLVRDQDSRDLAQTAMLEIFRGAKNYRGEASLEHWAKRIAVRVALRLAQAGRRVSRLESSTDPETLEAVLPSVTTEEGDEQLRACLDLLPDGTRELLFLRYGLNCTIEEIVAETGLSLGTVKARIRRGKEEMRRLLSQRRFLEKARMGR